jgi:hypothetical protein
MNEISIAWALAQKFHAGQFYGSDLKAGFKAGRKANAS